MTHSVNREPMQNERVPNHPISPLIIERWSPRAFLDKEVPQEILLSLFESARWAPSASNIQPWRYIVARNEQDRNTFLEFIYEGNKSWCKRAPVLALLISDKNTPKQTLNISHAFDAGTSWGYLALEAINQGLITHAMAGFDKDKARQTLQIPNSFDLHVVIAIGYQASPEILTEQEQAREKASERRDIQESLFEGSFGNRLQRGE